MKTKELATDALLEQASPRGWVANGKMTRDTEETLAGMYCVNRRDTREVIAVAYTDEDRKLICRAVNAFEEMRNALESAKEAIEGGREYEGCMGSIVDEIDAALARANGESELLYNRNLAEGKAVQS